MSLIGRMGGVAMAACLIAGVAVAQDSTTELNTATLAGICTSDPNFCDGYIVGAGQLYSVFLAADKIEPVACAEPPPTVDVIRTTFVTWAAANPSLGSEKAIDGVARAAAAKWPCPS